MNYRKETQNRVKVLARGLCLDQNAIWESIYTALASSPPGSPEHQAEDAEAQHANLAKLEQQVEQELESARKRHGERVAKLVGRGLQKSDQLAAFQVRENDLKKKIDSSDCLLKAKQADVEKLRAQLAEVKRSLEEVEQEKKQHEYDIVMSKNAKRETSDPNRRLLNIVLTAFTIVGISIALYFIAARSAQQ